MGLFKMDKILVSTEEFFALHRGIAEASNDQGLGLKLGTEERLERYDPVKIAAISARSFRDAIERVSRYKQLTCPEEVRVVERANESAVQFVWLLAHEKEPHFLVDVCFAWIVSMGCRGIGRPLIPKRVEFRCCAERCGGTPATVGRKPHTGKARRRAFGFSCEPCSANHGKR
jgi:hypothetical protein